MLIEVLSYDNSRNELMVVMPDGRKVWCDPFVSCAYELTEQEYEDGEPLRLVGSIVEIENDLHWHKGCLLPSEFSVVFRRNKELGQRLEPKTGNDDA